MQAPKQIWVKPGARRARVGGCHDGALVVAVSAKPVDGAANAAVTRALAAALGLRPRQVVIVRGATSRRKSVTVTDAPADLDDRWDRLLSTVDQ